MNLVQLLRRLQLVYASSQVVFDDAVLASEEIRSDEEPITDARDARENTYAEDNFEVKFTSINLEKEKATAHMKARFYDILEEEYNRTKAGGTSMITKLDVVYPSIGEHTMYDLSLIKLI
jgi:hypothetical protein